MLRVVVSGVSGRMGRAAAIAVAESPDLILVGGIERPGGDTVGSELSELVPRETARGAVTDGLEDADSDGIDVIIDFSTPEQAADCARYAARWGKGLVVGTTGLSDEQHATVLEATADCAVVLAPNMSIGANTLFALVAEAAASLGEEFDVEIVESHHSAKRDSPSGTALRLVDAVAGARGVRREEAMKAGRSGMDSMRRPGEIGVHSIRGGAVTGRHTVHFMSPLETVTLEHEALSRTVFAAGAVRAARFAGSAAPGLYDMMNVLGLAR